MYSDDYLTSNLEALRTRQGAVPALNRPGEGVRLEPDGDGVRLEVCQTDGRWVPHRGPRLSDGAAGASADVIVVGPGDGSTIATALDAAPRRRVLAIEPDPGLALLLLSSRDWTGVINAGRLAVVTGPTYVGSANAARLLRGEPTAAIAVDEVALARAPRAMAAARQLADRLAREAATNARARARLAGPYLLQTIANLPGLAREAHAGALRSLFHDIPIVLVAAGPSLDRTMPALRTYQDRALIVAADTTLRPLLRGGVRPHLMVSIDPSDLNGQHLSDVPDVEDIHLAGEGSLHPRALTAFAGRTFAFRISGHEPWRWLGARGADVSLVRAWGSVATAAFDLALQMGTQRVIFTGHDFAYSGNRPYCDNTRFHDEWRAYLANNPGTIEHYEDLMMNGRPTVEVSDIFGQPVRTGTQLIAYREWIADQSRLRTDVDFVNATEGGILQGPHIRQASLGPTLAELGPAGDVRERLRAAHAVQRRALTSVRDHVTAILDDATSTAWTEWTDFTAGTVSREQLERSLRDTLARWA